MKQFNKSNDTNTNEKNQIESIDELQSRGRPTNVLCGANYMPSLNSLDYLDKTEWLEMKEILICPKLEKKCILTGPIELVTTGNAGLYNRACDLLTDETQVTLQNNKRLHYTPTTLEDPIVHLLASQGEANIFAIDMVISTLMCVTRSVYPWDILVSKNDGILYFDKRKTSPIELFTVDENKFPKTAGENKECINSPQNLSCEASIVNQNFRKLVLTQSNDLNSELGESYSFSKSFSDNFLNNLNSYRCWSIGLELIMIRCTIHAYSNGKGGTQLLQIYAFNGCISQETCWRNRLKNKNKILSDSEVKNNSCKIAKWTAMSLLSGVDLLKIGYVVRNKIQENHSHIVIDVQEINTRDLAAQINLEIDKCWGLVKLIVDITMKFDDGKYLLVREEGAKQMRIFMVPQNKEEIKDT